MKRPTLELEIEKKVSELSLKLIKEKRQQILLYCFTKRNYKNFDIKNISHKYEKVQNFSLEVLTVRYNDDLLFREYPTGTFPHLLNKRYELADDLK
ncbi:hypothetical protein [Chryseobacterium daeguense]|uniref:hypothetical protein n=1 Tax=Chryseobacterium daeguense TaxID=412438 RepID=UPI00041DAADD|nr:hypothetical protein [Chryseobacterium daeguense]